MKKTLLISAFALLSFLIIISTLNFNFPAKNVVKNNKLAISKIVSGCNEPTKINFANDSFNPPYDLDCIRSKIINSDRSMEEQIALANSLTQTPAAFFCHVLTHSIGIAAYKESKNLGKFLLNYPQTCASGFLHGVQEEASRDQNPKEIIEETKKYCIFSDNIESRDRYYSCWHGVGHSIYLYSKGSIVDGFKYCQFATDKLAIFYCNTGLTMQNMLLTFSKDRSAELDCTLFNSLEKAACLNYPTKNIDFIKLDISKICNKFADDGLDTICRTGYIHRYLISEQYNFEKVRTICLNSKTNTYDNLCLHHLLQQAASSGNVEYDLKTLLPTLPSSIEQYPHPDEILTGASDAIYQTLLKNNILNHAKE